MPKAQRLLSCFKFSKRRPRLSMCCLPLVVLSFKKAKKKKKTKEILPKRDVNIFTRVSPRGQTSTRGILFLVIISLFEFFFFKKQTHTREREMLLKFKLYGQYTHTSKVQVAHAMKLFFFPFFF